MLISHIMKHSQTVCLGTFNRKNKH